MAMNANTLKIAMLTNLQTNLKPYFDGTTNISDIGPMTFDTLWGIICEAIATTTVAHITSLARCSGADSHGDSHDNVQIV